MPAFKRRYQGAGNWLRAWRGCARDSRRISAGHVLGIDRSAKAIKQAIDGSTEEIATGRLCFRHSAIEDFELRAGEEKFDLAFAVRVGALDGRHPELEKRAIKQIKKALKEDGSLFIDGGDPLKAALL